ncbi:MAG: flagellar motor stator protein MotA [Gemmatimonadales bacterium]|nr:flagellar motor stator protein MotA [Gemmatimonadales bacterium]
MIAIVGIVIVIASVLGSFMMAGGNPIVLFHLSEIIAIAGTALGTVFIGTPGPVLKSLGHRLPGLFKPSPYSQGLYLNALKMLFELFQVARKDGLVAIEAHIEAPDKSALFKKYPDVVAHHHPMEFLCDSLRLVLVGSVPPFDLESMMEAEIDVHHEESAASSGALQKVGDALPGIGIVAAVLGIVITMGAITGTVEEIGEHVAAALTGTLLGILLSYGFLGPMVSGLEHAAAAESRFYNFLKASVVAFAKGYAPIVACEFARRAVSAEVRPTFADMEKAVKGK